MTLIYKMKIIYGTFETKKSFISSIMTLLTEKYSSQGSNPQINMLGLLNLFLKDEPIAINP